MWQRERDRQISHLQQIPTVAGAGLDQSQEQACHLALPYRWQEPTCLAVYKLPPRHLNRKLDQKQKLDSVPRAQIWDKADLTHCAAMLSLWGDLVWFDLAKRELPNYPQWPRVGEAESESWPQCRSPTWIGSPIAYVDCCCPGSASAGSQSGAKARCQTHALLYAHGF